MNANPFEPIRRWESILKIKLKIHKVEELFKEELKQDETFNNKIKIIKEEIEKINARFKQYLVEQVMSGKIKEFKKFKQDVRKYESEYEKINENLERIVNEKMSTVDINGVKNNKVEEYKKLNLEIKNVVENTDQVMMKYWQIFIEDNTRFGPTWYKMLNPALWPIDNMTINKIDDYRKKYCLTDDMISQMINMTRWAVVRIQYYCLEHLKMQTPHRPEQELWKQVLLSRLNLKLSFLQFESDPFAKPISKKELLSRINDIDNIISKFRNFEDVINYIVEMDEEENRFYDFTPSHPLQIMHELNDLLEEGKDSNI